MNLVEAKYHLRRLGNMIWHGGFRYTLNYFSFLAFYNSDLVSEKIFHPLFPKSVFYPRYIEVEVSTACNLKCQMCEHTYWKEKNQTMTFEQLKSIVDQFPKLKWVGLTGIGESFLNPDFLEMIRYVKKKNLYLELYDSFFLINKECAKVLVETKVDRMIVSLDAATPETYEKIRKGAKFTTVVEHIKNLRKIKRSSKKYHPEIIFHYIISKNNVKEVLPFVDLVKEIMGEEMTSIYFTAILHPFDEIKDLVVVVPDGLIKETTEKCYRLGIKVAWNRNIPTEKDNIRKCNEWTMPFVFVDGTVIPCCAGNEANKRDYQRETSLGNILKTPFREIWNSPSYRTLRQRIHDGKTPPACRYCTIYKV